MLFNQYIMQGLNIIVMISVVQPISPSAEENVPPGSFMGKMKMPERWRALPRRALLVTPLQKLQLYLPLGRKALKRFWSPWFLAHNSIIFI